MSKSGFAFSAAYSAVPVRGVWMQRDVDSCTWSNYNDHCLMRACPGQVFNGTMNWCHCGSRFRAVIMTDDGFRRLMMTFSTRAQCPGRHRHAGLAGRRVLGVRLSPLVWRADPREQPVSGRLDTGQVREGPVRRDNVPLGFAAFMWGPAVPLGLMRIQRIRT